ncbi:transcriptional regulator [Stutzerimonas stutzeri]|uniref:Transcriptional regulator n=1 Tax=Stutzerimonas stutzeri TaxID=316 RepID=W8RCV0_STUST|nr:response regulator transcription factor [Stutzerimonas stutzeri]AHL76292.1 transcriptional regulator [Stutzerimonas stutzeri]MCQ4329522.1 response regulator transcription factor [Stutzerimonas stutzeri]
MTTCAAQQILAIEDDPVLGPHLRTSLENRGFEVTLADDGPTGLALARDSAYDLILLDVMLPDLSGMELLTRLRTERRTPVLMMSALGNEAHRIQGFDCGADDYLPKPFSLDELLVRIAAILRRVAYERSVPSAANDDRTRFDDQRGDVHHEGRWIGLTATEYRLMKVLHEASGEVLSKPFLYQQALRRGYSQHDRSLDMHISNIRRKLARERVIELRLESVWGKGYVLELQAP